MHGHYDLLEKLLLDVGCSPRGRSFVPPDDLRIRFVGDLVDRGHQVRRCLECIRDMVEHGYARTIVGNHELNLLSFCHSMPDGRPLRPHTPKNKKQVEATLRAFEHDEDELEDYLLWMQDQPIVIEEAGFRMVHACWHDPDIDYMRKHYPENKLNDRLLIDYADLDTPAHICLNRMLSGVAISLPEAYAFNDPDGHPRTELRVAWWNPMAGKTLHELDTKDLGLPNQEVPQEVLPQEDFAYPNTDPPLFLGHYCFEGPVGLLRPNVACTDFCVIQQGRLAGYLFDGEQTLNEKRWRLATSSR